MENGIAPNAKRLLWAGFFTIFANGVGFAVRGAILVDWARQYGFTQKELGDITGGGLWGFGVMIILGSLIADSFGYGRLMIVAFAMHLLSGALQMCTGPIFDAFGRDGVYWSLTMAMVMFSIANGICEAVINPMVATLFPKQKTHYLNILHAGWPGGLVAGGVISYLMNGGTIFGWAPIGKVHWLIQMSMFLVPVVLYGLMMLGQHLPRSEASRAGVSYGTMLAEFASPILILLLVIHAMVGYVELGTDSWIQKITGTITESRETGILLFIFTNILMFSLRFVAGPIEHVLSPLGLLFTCAVIATAGLMFLGNAEGAFWCLLAVTVYGIGKTFYWPTMLAVVSERFPKGGALTLGAVGGMGMLSAGFLGGPIIGIQQDYYASKELKEEAPATYARYAVEKEKSFLGAFETKGVDNAKVGLLKLGLQKTSSEEEAQKIGSEMASLPPSDPKFKTLAAQKKEKEAAAKELDIALEKLRKSSDPEQRKLADWWEANGKYAKEDSGPLDKADLYGGRMALKWTAYVPATMAALYLFLIVFYKLQGGYKRVELEGSQPSSLH